MIYEYSCGAVLFTRAFGDIRYVLVIAPDFVFGLPKGHMEGEETELQTAMREIREETGIVPKIIDGFKETIEYDLPQKPGVRKRVTYFLAEYGESALTVPANELSGLCRAPYKKAMELIGNDGLKAILKKANDVLTA